MKIYTRTGDDGSTGLFGGGRVGKDHPIIRAYGTVDETNSVIGMARAFIEGAGEGDDVDLILSRIQRDLFVVGADLATPLSARPSVPRVSLERIGWLETTIDELDRQLPPLARFILPGGSRTAATLHVARTTCRRAERLSIEASVAQPINEYVIPYLNRLSDLLFVLARFANQHEGIQESEWKADQQ